MLAPATKLDSAYVTGWLRRGKKATRTVLDHMQVARLDVRMFSPCLARKLLFARVNPAARCVLPIIGFLPPASFP
jgi:hypothetical protein